MERRKKIFLLSLKRERSNGSDYFGFPVVSPGGVHGTIYCMHLTVIYPFSSCRSCNREVGDLIDMHSHILPGLDDGAAGWVQALAMVRVAVEDGIAEIVCTRPLHNRIATLFRHSALDAESSYFKQFWIPAFAGMT
jgi:hypothetical protein